MKTTKPVRQFLTSGDAGQEVRDDGSFRALFLRAIRGGSRADVNNDGYVTGDELGLYLSQEVTHLTATAQTPRWGRLQDVRFNDGDFVVKSKEGGGLSAPSQPVSSNLPALSSQTNTAEVEFWKSIRDSEDPSDFYYSGSDIEGDDMRVVDFSGINKEYFIISFFCFSFIKKP